jgi:DNA polymerase-3 subunit beta
MKFICLQENLKRGLAIVSHINNKNINLPILNNVLIRANDNGIELISTNLEIGITHQLRGKLEEPGESTVDAKIISDYVNLLPAEKIELKEFEDGIDIKCGNYKTKIKGESSKEFPLIPLIDKDKFCELNIFDFRKALNSVAFAVANNDNRMELSGVFFQFQDNFLTMASTDSYRFRNTSQPCILSIRRKHSRYYLFTWIYSPCRYPPELCIRYLLFKTYAFVPLKVQVL